VSFEPGRKSGGLAVEPHLAGFEECAEFRSVSKNGLPQDVIERGAIEFVFTYTGRVVRGAEQNELGHVTGRSIVRCR
jgi:hypothetical protein